MSNIGARMSLGLQDDSMNRTHAQTTTSIVPSLRVNVFSPVQLQRRLQRHVERLLPGQEIHLTYVEIRQVETGSIPLRNGEISGGNREHHQA